MRCSYSSTSCIAVLLVLCCLPHLTSAATPGLAYRDVDMTVACSQCAHNSSQCRAPAGAGSVSLYNYCGMGGVTVPSNNFTLSTAMCCLATVSNVSSNPWECQRYSGPTAAHQQLVNGFQCYDPMLDKAVTAFVVALWMIVLIVFVCCLSPFIACCVCCYCFGRCRTRSESLPRVVTVFTPTWMLQPQHAQHDPSLYQRMV